MREELFRECYNHHQSALMSFALKLTKSYQDAQDLVQDTLIKAYNNFNSYTGIDDKGFKNWSFTILKNTFITKYRKRKKMKIVATPVEDLLFMVSPNISTSKSSHSTKAFTYLHNCINQLSTASKDVFLLYINGYSYNEISEVKGIPLGTVKSRINYARKKLANLIDRKVLFNT